MINKFWDKQCPLTNKERLYIVLHAFNFCTYKKQTELYCQNCSKSFRIENAFRNYKELAKDLNRAYPMDLAWEVVNFAKENYGVEISEKTVDEFAKKYKWHFLD